jgi:hypothetical protein
MNGESITTTPTFNKKDVMQKQNIVIGVLILLLILSFLGINLLQVTGDFLQSIVQLFGPIVYQFLSLLGLTTGTVINKTTDVVEDTAKVSVDLAGGAVHDIGDLLINASKNVPNTPILDDKINKSFIKQTPEPVPDKTENPIQNPVTSNKTKWCLVGEYQGRRGCIEISEQDKCISGQVFPEQKLCLNPTLSH